MFQATQEVKALTLELIEMAKNGNIDENRYNVIIEKLKYFENRVQEARNDEQTITAAPPVRRFEV